MTKGARAAAIALGLAAAAALCWYLLKPQAPSGEPPAAVEKAGQPSRRLSPAPAVPEPGPAPKASPGAAPAAQPGAPAAKAGASAPDAPPAPPPPPPPRPEDDPARIEADSVALDIRHFGQRFGGNPVGTNAEIVKAMMGGNEGRATYLSPQLQRLNDDGELIDRWGTPYFFHQNSATDTEVRSAGPDKVLWTIDDVIAK